MACLPSEDILSSTGVSVLLVLTTPTTLENLAHKTELPLFRVRGTVRRLLEAGLVHKVEERYEITPEGSRILAEKT